MASHVTVAPPMLQWARRRSGLRVADLVRRFPKLVEWEAGVASPTLKQLEAYAQATHTPVGFMFLAEPPAEPLPVPDFRTFRDQEVRTPTPDLLDTVYSCEERQAWYRDYAIVQGHERVSFVGSASAQTDPVAAAAELRETLGFGLARRVDFSNWSGALSGLIEHAESIGVLVMVSGIVGANTHRKLDPEEFRGFALADDYAPVIFINGADFKAAQIFTLAHELAHVALGESAVSKPDLADTDLGGGTEQWCNRVAAELLVPMASVTLEYNSGPDLPDELDRLAKFYKVSTLVVLRRIYDSGRMSVGEFSAAYERERDRVMGFAARTASGGNFYNTQPVRISKTFTRAVISDATEGRTLYRDAFRLLGSKKVATFEALSRQLGVA